MIENNFAGSNDLALKLTLQESELEQQEVIVLL